MNGPHRRPTPARQKHSPIEEAATAQRRATDLLREITYWLDALERFHDIRNAPRRAFTITRCSGGGGNHWWHVRLEPGRGGAQHVACTAPRDRYPDDVLLKQVIEPLQQAGFRVSSPTHHRCGCATFTAHPRKSPGV